MRIGARLGRMLGLFVFGLASSFPLWAQSPGTIATVAGDGTAGNTAESGAATAAKLETAYGVVMDAQGNLYIADSWNHSIRKVAPGGTVSRSAGSNYEGTYGDGSTATYANLSYPRGLAIDAGGNLYIADSGNSKVRKISPDGIIRAFAGTGTDGYSGDGGAATAARLKFPRALAVDSAGNVYIADTWNYRVRKVTPSGTISTVAGDGTYGYSGDGTLATSASIGLIQALAVDPQDNLVLLDGYNHCLRKVTANGIITTIAGGSTAGYSGDGGPATAARFSYPRGLAIDFLGNIFVADSFNHRIRQIKPDGTISTLAGTGAAGYSGDNGPATAAQLNFPYGLAVSLRGDVFVTDLRNYRVRKVVMATAGAAPGISAGGVVNAATFKGPVSPGAIISIFGQGFATRAFYAPSLPLPTSLGGIIVTVGSKAIPLLYVDSKQINAQLPFSTAPGRTSVKVNFVGTESATLSLDVSFVAPGIFWYGESQGAILNQDYAVNTPQNPAARGSVVIIYATGQGAVTPAVADGAAAPSSTLARTQVTPVVTIGGKEASVQASCLAPGFVGLWQINVSVPAGAPTGNAVPVQITLAGAASNTVTMAIR